MILKSFSYKVFLISLVIILIGGYGSAFFSKAYANSNDLTSNDPNKINSWFKGANISPTSTNIDLASSNYKQSLQVLKNTGATDVSLVATSYQDSTDTSIIHNAWDTPTDASLISGIDYAHSLGLRVMLKPHIDLMEGSIWRAKINPTNRTEWFNSYAKFINNYAQIAQSHNVELFCIGTELVDMSSSLVNESNTQNWITIISGIRNIFKGKLTYASNPSSDPLLNESAGIMFWSYLDIIGIDGYFDFLTHQSDPSINQLKEGWVNWNNTIVSPLHNKYNLPVIFTEVGYKSVKGSNTRPWDYTYDSGAQDQNEQANAYEALFEYWQNYTWMQGIFLWNWEIDPNSDGNVDKNYTPQNKLAQNILSQWYKHSVGNYQTPSFSISNVNTLNNNLNHNISISVKNSGSSSSSIIADFEMYDSNNVKVFQKIFNNQAFNNDGINTYELNWLSRANENYVLKLGIFVNNWATLMNWFDKVATISNNLNDNIKISPSLIPTTVQIIPSSTVQTTSPSITQSTSITKTPQLPSTPIVAPTPVINYSLAQPVPLIPNFNINVQDQPVVTQKFDSSYVLNTNISNSGEPIKALVDFEVYDSNNDKVFQKTFDNKLINSDPSTYKALWTPTYVDRYTFSVGIFNSDWTNNYLWISNSLSINVVNTTNVNYVVSNWWPVDNSNLTSIQPFKAVIENYPLSDYKLYWQVDSGNLNLMNDTDLGGLGFKQSDVDLTKWNWNTEGNYNINFIAKDLSKNVIGQKSIIIHKNTRTLSL